MSSPQSTSTLNIHQLPPHLSAIFNNPISQHPPTRVSDLLLLNELKHLSVADDKDSTYDPVLIYRHKSPRKDIITKAPLIPTSANTSITDMFQGNINQKSKNPILTLPEQSTTTVTTNLNSETLLQQVSSTAITDNPKAIRRASRPSKVSFTKTMNEPFENQSVVKESEGNCSEIIPASQKGSSERPKVYVLKACVNCKLSHVACDVSRPCQRCLRLGKGDSCIDAERKKRGRPCNSSKMNSLSSSVKLPIPRIKSAPVNAISMVPANVARFGQESFVANTSPLSRSLQAPTTIPASSSPVAASFANFESQQASPTPLSPTENPEAGKSKRLRRFTEYSVPPAPSKYFLSNTSHHNPTSTSPGLPPYSEPLPIDFQDSEMVEVANVLLMTSQGSNRQDWNGFNSHFDTQATSQQQLGYHHPYNYPQKYYPSYRDELVESKGFSKMVESMQEIPSQSSFSHFDKNEETPLHLTSPPRYWVSLSYNDNGERYSRVSPRETETIPYKPHFDQLEPIMSMRYSHSSNLPYYNEVDPATFSPGTMESMEGFIGGNSLVDGNGLNNSSPDFVAGMSQPLHASLTGDGALFQSLTLPIPSPTRVSTSPEWNSTFAKSNAMIPISPNPVQSRSHSRPGYWD